MREFVLTTPQGLKFRLRTAVSGRLVIKPAPNVLLEDGHPAPKVLVEVKTEDGFQDATDPHQREGSVASDVTEICGFEDMVGAVTHPAQLVEVAAEVGLKARDTAFGTDYVRAPPQLDAYEGYPDIPFNRIPSVVSTYETVNIAFYVTIYKSAFGPETYRDVYCHRYAIPGKILKRLLELGYTSMEEYEKHLLPWDWESFHRYEKMCKDRIAARKPGYLPDGQYPWRVAGVHPPQVLPSLEDLPKLGSIKEYRLCLREEFRFYHPPTFFKQAINRQAEVTRHIAAQQEEGLEERRAALLERMRNEQNEEALAPSEGKGKGKAPVPADGEPRGTVRTLEEAEAEWALYTKKTATDKDARPMKRLRTQASSISMQAIQINQFGAGPSNTTHIPPTPAPAPAGRGLGASVAFLNIHDPDSVGMRGVVPTGSMRVAPAPTMHRALGTSATFSNMNDADALSTPGAGPSTGVGRMSFAQLERAASVESDAGSDAATEAGSDATEPEDDESAPPRTTRPLARTQTFYSIMDA
ncbi:hypothetical protein BD626DRAFT_571572 [Schizophyllum amplum]|uniref:Uncharacterized protein n=1 Tax=Schizophyllum amplum TaxID=97359 RepID=A0A550C707_9AGAR|nr:hypothetical protein BD626DRAFT_571572 [Auriculariopsis ampla]